MPIVAPQSAAARAPALTLAALEKLGRLPANFDGAALLPLLSSPKPRARQLAATNLGKLKQTAFLPHLLQTAKHDASAAVRREATAAIGRMRGDNTAAALIELAQDPDPNVALQALRGLLALPKKSAATQAAIQKLRAHPNEMVRDIVQKENTFTFDSADARRAQIESPDFMKNVVVHGDVLDTLKTIPDNSVHLTFTSPPYYNARDYSVYKSYSDYLRFMQKVFKAVHRVTKTGRFLVLNTSPVIVPRISRQHASKRYPIPFDLNGILTKMGWEFIEDIVWVKPEASVKNRNGGFFQHRKPLAYKPNICTEYLMVYRKHTSRLLDWNIRLYPPEQIDRSRVSGDYESTNVWQVDPTYDKTHSAVFPVSLCTRVIKYYSMADDLVFDPFGGSGTLGGAAAQLGRFFFMTELSGEYIGRMTERFSRARGLFLPQPRIVDLPRLRQMKKAEE